VHPFQRGVRTLLALALTAGLQPASARADVQGFHYTREVAVAAPGWVRVPLDLAALQRLGPGMTGLHVISPTGGETPLRIEPAPPREERRPAGAFQVEAATGGWLLRIDLGPEPIVHDGLRITTVRSPLPAPASAESSADGVVWKPLSGFRSEVAEGGRDLSYPKSTDRYLRLAGNRRTEAPRVSAAEARIVVGSSLPVSLKPACEPSAPGGSVCTLTLPVAGQGVWRITLEVAAKGVVGYRLQAARDARWSPVAEGTWQPSGDRVRHSVDLFQATVAGSVLRLALHAVGSQPQLLSATADLVVQTVLFRAEEAGVYSLAYGGVLKPEPKKVEAPAGVAATWLAPGPERERALPVLPAIATAPVVRPREGKFSTAWRIAAPAARPGGLVRLELPSLVYAQARADLGNLRVMSGDRQIPFQVWSPEEPAAALADRDLRLQGSGGRRSGDSSVEIHLPEPGLPLSQIVLTAPSVPLRRAVALRYLEPSTTPAREIRRRGRPTLVQDTWECRPQPPLPCRDLLPLPGRAPSVVEVSFHDGDNPPLAGLGAELWRRRDVLLFVWPETETPVRLVAGPDTLTTPSYDLQALGDALLTYPSQPAEISQGRAAARLQPWWSRWMRPMILLAAVAGLLLVLRRILMEA
jgi:hypothetical protein